MSVEPGKGSARPSPVRIVIVGGGAAAIEALLALRDLGGDRAELTLAAPNEDFVLKPLSVKTPFEGEQPLSFGLAEITGRVGATFERKSAVSVDDRHRIVVLRDGTELPYDFVVVATGAKSLWSVPGATTFWDLNAESSVQEILERLATGEARHIAFAVPGGPSWPLPAYELALRTSHELERLERTDAKLMVVTGEEKPLEQFGFGASTQVAALLEAHGVEFVGQTVPIGFDGSVLETSRGTIPVDEVLVLPSLEGRRLDGVPFDESGFVPVDEYGRIAGLESEAYAAGDVTDHPLKFGGIATQQADTVAAAIAAKAWGAPSPPPFSPGLQPVISTGEGSIRLTVGEQPSESAPPDRSVEPTEKILGRYLTPFLDSLIR
jgi:sulfide:quinone oxidoreductase